MDYKPTTEQQTILNNDNTKLIFKSNTALSKHLGVSPTTGSAIVKNFKTMNKYNIKEIIKL